MVIFYCIYIFMLSLGKYSIEIIDNYSGDCIVVFMIHIVIGVEHDTTNSPVKVVLRLKWLVMYRLLNMWNSCRFFDIFHFITFGYKK